MSDTTPKKVILLGDPIYEEAQLNALDAYGGGEIMPGMLLERTAGGEVAPHSSGGGFASPMFAVEAPFRLGADINTAYDEDGENVSFAFCRNGDRVYALIDAGENISENDLLESAGNGYLAGGSTLPVARALETVDNSAGSEAVRIRCEVV